MIHGLPGIDDIFHNEYVLAGYIKFNILAQAEISRLGFHAVTCQPEKIDLDVQLYFPDKVCHEHESTIQYTYHQKAGVCVIPGDNGAKLLNAPGNSRSSNDKFFFWHSILEIEWAGCKIVFFLFDLKSFLKTGKEVLHIDSVFIRKRIGYIPKEMDVGTFILNN